MRTTKAPLQLVSFLMSLALIGCGPPKYVSNWGELKTGTTKEEVKAILGQPSSVFFPNEDGEPVLTERWQYDDSLSSLIGGLTFPIAPSTDVFVVHVDAEGRVERFRRPSKGKYAQVEDESGSNQSEDSPNPSDY